MGNWKINLAASWIAQFLSILGFTAALPFTPFFIRELGITKVDEVALWAGTITAAGSVAMAIISPVWGMMADRHGRKLMVERAAFGGALIMTAMAFSANVEQLLVLRILQGAITGTIPAFIALVASFVPPDQVGFSLGLMQMAVYTGFSIGPLVGGVIADQLGYRWTFGVTGLLLLIAGILVLFVIQEKFERPRDKDEQSGLGDSLRAITHSWPMLGAIVALGGVYLANFSPQPIIPLFVESLQQSALLINTTTGTVYGANALASAISAALIGRLSDRVGYRTTLLACSLGAIVTYVGQAVTPNLSILIAASFTTGLFTGGILPAANAILAHTAPRESQGAIYGISNSVNAGGRALGPLLGATFATFWGLRAAFWTAAVLFIFVLAWVALVIRARPQVAGD